MEYKKKSYSLIVSLKFLLSLQLIALCIRCNNKITCTEFSRIYNEVQWWKSKWSTSKKMFAEFAYCLICWSGKTFFPFFFKWKDWSLGWTTFTEGVKTILQIWHSCIAKRGTERKKKITYFMQREDNQPRQKLNKIIKSFFYCEQGHVAEIMKRIWSKFLTKPSFLTAFLAKKTPIHPLIFVFKIHYSNDKNKTKKESWLLVL